MQDVEQKAINHAVLLKLANYSQKRLAELKGLDNLIMTSDPNWLSFNLSRLFAVETSVVDNIRDSFTRSFKAAGNQYQILHFSDPLYPERLRKTADPPLFLYCRGDLRLFKGKTIAIVGSRAASDEGLRRAWQLARFLTRAGYTVVSGLAAGVDAKGHIGAIEEGGKTIAVIGTPLEQSYPKENRVLQEQIARDHLLVTQYHPGHPVNRYNFATRNYTTSGISLATVIVEAGETSGTLIQARQCISQGRHLFLLKSLVDRKGLTWPKKYVNKGAVVVSSVEEIIAALQKAPEYRKPENQNTLFE